jgi:uncharacterized phage-like protein YoqJ
MTFEDEKYYENFFTLFASDGWKQFVTLAKESREAFTIENIKDGESLRFIQGQLLVTNNVLSFADVMKDTYDTIKAEESSNDA